MLLEFQEHPHFAITTLHMEQESFSLTSETDLIEF